MERLTFISSDGFPILDYSCLTTEIFLSDSLKPQKRSQISKLKWQYVVTKHGKHGKSMLKDGGSAAARGSAAAEGNSFSLDPFLKAFESRILAPLATNLDNRFEISEVKVNFNINPTDQKTFSFSYLGLGGAVSKNSSKKNKFEFVLDLEGGGRKRKFHPELSRSKEQGSLQALLEGLSGKIILDNYELTPAYRFEANEFRPIAQLSIQFKPESLNK
jgi:hypothetical protein